MIEYILIFAASFSASLISFYSGFGLGTLLTPVLAIFLPLPAAIGTTAVVHLAHNLLKAQLLRKSIRWDVVLKFGLPAMVASIPGALLLKGLSLFASIKKYTIFSVITGEISILHISIGVLFIAIAALETTPHKPFRVNNLPLGGVISGFFGGLSGNQGAFRGAFLMGSDLQKEAFIGTNAIIAAIVDTVRLLIYLLSFSHLFANLKGSLLILAIGGAFFGIALGMIGLHKVTIAFIQKVIIGLLYLFGVLFIFGIL